MSKILIVDSDPHLRELASVFLRNAGFEIIEASDGQDALAKLDSTKGDLFVIDITMPKMDAWEFCRELCAAYDLPILMLTARGETSQKVKALLRRYKIFASQTVQAVELFMDWKTFAVPLFFLLSGWWIGRSVLSSETLIEVVLMDATESLIEHPKKTDATLQRKKEAPYPKSRVDRQPENRGNDRNFIWQWQPA
jgi:CheY-like chemotaxis protein